MKQISTLIIDDEPQAIRRIERFISIDPVFDIKGKCQNVNEAKQIMNEKRIDLLFLDIEMPGTSGIEFMASLPPGPGPKVVFVTAYNDYAVMAFEYFALDYLLKPFSNERILKTIDRIKNEFVKSEVIQDWSLINNFIKDKEVPKDRLIVKTGNKFRFVAFTEINYILANGAYVTLVTHARQRVLCRDSLTNLIGILEPYGFMRIHHGAVVFTAHIAGVNRLNFGDMEVVMNDGEHIRVSRPYKKTVKNKLLDKANKIR